MKIPILILSTGVLLQAAVFGAPNEPPAPVLREPLVSGPPPHSMYSVTIGYGDNSPSATRGDRPVRIEVWRDASSRKIVVTHANGERSEGYLFESGFVVRSTADPAKTFVTTSAKGLDAVFDLFTNDYQGLQWLEKRWYSGVTEANGAQFHSFRKSADPMPEVAADATEMPAGFRPVDHMDLTATLRIQDQSPATIQLGGTTYTFSPVEPWQGAINLPESFRTSADAFVRESKILEGLKKKPR